MIVVNVFYLVICLIGCVITQDPFANLPQGRIVGVRDNLQFIYALIADLILQLSLFQIKVFTENSFTPIEAFFGIPYAAPPLGRLRFSVSTLN